MTKTYAAHELAKLIDDNDSIDQVNGWLRRGDGVAVYENLDFDSVGAGEKRFLSFGSDEAQFPGDPPEQLPDFANAINWRFRLTGTYRGDQLRHLPTPDEIDWATPFTVAEAIVNGFTGHPKGIKSWTLRVNVMPDDNADRMTVTIELSDSLVDIMAFVYPEGVNRLASFDWAIQNYEERRTGADPNLGGTIVSTYNLCLPSKEQA